MSPVEIHHTSLLLQLPAHEQAARNHRARTEHLLAFPTRREPQHPRPLAAVSGPKTWFMGPNPRPQG